MNCFFNKFAHIYLSVFRTDLYVRGYELDSFRHVNNAAYLNYFEQARWEVLKKAGFLDEFVQKDLLLAVIDVHIRYMKELKVFEEVFIETKISSEGLYLIFRHIIVNKQSRIKHARATIKTLLLDKDKNITDYPDDFFNRLNAAGSE